MSTTYIYLPGKNDKKIWEVLIKTVEENTPYIKDFERNDEGKIVYDDKKRKKVKGIKNTEMQKIIKALIEYEKGKKPKDSFVGNCIGAAPFAVPTTNTENSIQILDSKKKFFLKKFNDFLTILHRLGNKYYSTATEEAKKHRKENKYNSTDIENDLLLLQKSLNPYRLNMYGKEMTLRDLPLEDNDGKNVIISQTISSANSRHNRVLCIQWDSHYVENTKSWIRVKVVDANNEEVDKKKSRLTEIMKFDINDDKFKDQDTFVYAYIGNENDDFVDDAPWLKKQGQYFVPKVSTANNYKYQVLYDVDRFRLKIDGKYKTIFDLFELLKLSEKLTLKDALWELSLAVYELNKKPSVPWEGPLKIAKTWKKLTYEQKVLNILSSTIDKTVVDVELSNHLDGIIESLVPIRLNDKSFFQPLVEKGGSQRHMTTNKKRKFTSVASTQLLEGEFVFEGQKLLAEQQRKKLNEFGWKESMFLLKKNDRVDGKKFVDFAYLKTSHEYESCCRLRRIERLLNLSEEKGYPVLQVNVAAPFSIQPTTSTQRSTVFGVSNYDRTQIYPAVQPAPLVMASSGSVETVDIFDVQSSFSETNAKKHKFLIKVATKDNKLYHPLYPNKIKEDSNRKIMGFVKK